MDICFPQKAGIFLAGKKDNYAECKISASMSFVTVRE
jgi:hypothetical protein